MYKKKNDLLTSGIKILNQFGLDQSRLESEIFLSFTLKVRREVLPIFTSEVLDYKTAKKFFSLVERRTFKEPVAYLKEEKEFYSLAFYVNRNVLIPRSETEIIPEYVINSNIVSSSILEIGVGSGNIINSLNHHIKTNTYHGFDLSVAAIKVALKNKKLLKCVQTHFFESDLFREIGLNSYDYLISNPPYIKSEDLDSLMEDVKSFEPALALDGGMDGLNYYREIASYGKKVLKQNGKVLVEIGEKMSDDVINIFSRHYTIEEKISDLASIPRILIFRIKK